MSAQPPGGFSNAGKKAVHVKWAGKTIALGTFPSSEADEKCARAKALTRAWRSTMRPKPTRDWVMLELERLGVRVVSGRLGRKAGEDGDDDMPPVPSKKGGPATQTLGSGIGSPNVERTGSIGWGHDGDLNNLMNRRTSLGLSMMNDGRRGSLGSLGQVIGLDGGDPTLGHRQLGGYDVEAQRRASSLGLGTLTGGGLGGMGMSVNPNQHYEMLKLHHMNLLNEIQETTLMMNLYQQQQLQQQQQQLQQQANVEGLVGGDPQLAMMHQMNGLDPMFGQLSQQQRASLGLGSSGNFGAAQMQMMQHQQLLQGGGGGLHQQLQQSQQAAMPPQQQPTQDITRLSTGVAKEGGDGGSGTATSVGDNKKPADAEGLGDVAKMPAKKVSAKDDEEDDDEEDEDDDDDDDDDE